MQQQQPQTETPSSKSSQSPSQTETQQNGPPTSGGGTEMTTQPIPTRPGSNQGPSQQQGPMPMGPHMGMPPQYRMMPPYVCYYISSEKVLNCSILTWFAKLINGHTAI